MASAEVGTEASGDAAPRATASSSLGAGQAYGTGYNGQARPAKRSRPVDDEQDHVLAITSNDSNGTSRLSSSISNAGQVYGKGGYNKSIPATRVDTVPASDSLPEAGPSRHSEPQGDHDRAPPSRTHPSTTPLALAPSFFGTAPVDEFTKEIGDWVWGWCNNRTNVEIEAKIGFLLDNRPNLPPRTRVSFPVANETILTDSTFARFESNMPIAVHHHFNQKLNAQVGISQHANYPGGKIRYQHTKEIDSFYSNQGDRSKKVRVTRNKDSGELKAGGSIIKSRVADMNIFSPKRKFDYRISISIEEPVPLPTGKATHSREKDRVSYRHQSCTVDLTQVKTPEKNEVLHELEVEFADMPLLMREGYKAVNGVKDHLYYELIQIFINNIRMLLQKAAEPL